MNYLTSLNTQFLQMGAGNNTTCPKVAVRIRADTGKELDRALVLGTRYVVAIIVTTLL